MGQKATCDPPALLETSMEYSYCDNLWAITYCRLQERNARLDRSTLTVTTMLSRTPEHLNDVTVKLLKVVGDLLQGIAGIVAVLWLSTLGLAQYHCSVIPWVGSCDKLNNAWLLPVLFAPIGFPALIASIVILAIRWIARSSD
jgi:hypothetical protein